VKYYTTIASGYDANARHIIGLVYCYAESENEAIGLATTAFLARELGGNLDSVAAYDQSPDDLLRAYCRTAEIGEAPCTLFAGEAGRGTVQWVGIGDRAVVVAVVEQSGAGDLAETMKSPETQPFAALGPVIVEMFKSGLGLFGAAKSRL
jgi:hypothetical protein